MATLTITQIAQLALNAGVQNGQQLYISVAIALAESSGRTDAVNVNNDGSKDVGVWQINDVHKLLWTGRQDDRTDPVQNAKYMFSISAGMSWSPWTTYNDGSYNNHMQQVMSELQNANLSRGTQVQLSNPSTLGGGYGTAPQILNLSDVPGLSELKSTYATIDKFFKFLTNPDGWVRILKIGIGVIMIIAGIVLMMRSEIVPVAELAALA